MKNLPKLIESKSDTHRLLIGKREVEYPRVTAIIRSAGFYDFSQIPKSKKKDLEDAQTFGTAVHVACEYWDLGVLEEARLDPRLIPYLDGWKKFRAEISWAKKPLLNETVVYSDLRRYAGRLDRVFGKASAAIVGDIKSGVVGIEAAMQSAAYKEAAEECLGIKVSKRFAIQLKDDGTYKLWPFKNPWDINAFHSALNIFNYKRGAKV